MNTNMSRAISIDTGNWVYGNYIDQVHGCVPIIVTDVWTEDNCSLTWDYEFVKQETVGRYTGFSDKNFKHIFEGDIIKHLVGGKELIGIVEYADGSFGVRIVTGGSQFLCFFIDNTCEILGNIHENQIKVV